MLKDQVREKEVAIVVPLSFRSDLNESEKISLQHLEYFLGEYDHYFLAPQSLRFKYQRFPIERFKDDYFGSTDAHTHLCLSKDLYRRFVDYDYILMYHLDSLVFNSNLSEWCKLGYDFIGAPWIKGPDLPWLEENGVGNGGFSLRKVKSFLKLLNSGVPWRRFDAIPKRGDGPGEINRFRYIKKASRNIIPGLNNIQRHIEVYIRKSRHDDKFLYFYAKKYYPEFAIAPIEVALRFAFEANPRICYELNNHQVPFGCHAWEKYDREFWLPYILSYKSAKSG
jgi:hypothetical protein